MRKLIAAEKSISFSPDEVALCYLRRREALMLAQSRKIDLRTLLMSLSYAAATKFVGSSAFFGIHLRNSPPNSWYLWFNINHSKVIETAGLINMRQSSKNQS